MIHEDLLHEYDVIMTEKYETAVANHLMTANQTYHDWKNTKAESSAKKALAEKYIGQLVKLRSLYLDRSDYDKASAIANTLKQYGIRTDDYNPGKWRHDLQL